MADEKKIATLYSPSGSKVTVAVEDADTLKAQGFSASKPKSE